MAGPGVMVNGQTTSDAKIVYDCLPGTTQVMLFMSEHFLVRPKRDRKTLKITVKDTNSQSAAMNCIKALKALCVYQMAHWQHGIDDHVWLNGKKLNANGELTTMMKMCGLQTAKMCPGARLLW
jgi:hypothetical protein